MTRVPNKCAWEYCIYINDNDYGYYDQNNSKVSKPFGMLVVKTPGPSGIIKVKISKSLINNPDAIRYTIATFAPSQPSNLDTLFQGGSSAVDVFPGTKETFGGEINGYGEVTPLGDKGVKNYTIYYVYSGINPIAEYAPNGSVLARYIYAGGRHIAKVAGADTHWYHCDALGSPRKMTDENGTVVWTATYYPFGEMTAGSGNTHGFTGKEYDSEMGLNYFCQRYYDPQIGRFMTLDPFGGYIELPQSQNRYAYCIGNPLKYIDPLGLFYNSIIPPGGVYYDGTYVYGYGRMPGASASIYPGYHMWHWHWNSDLLGGDDGDLCGRACGPLPGSYGYDSRHGKRGGRPQNGGSGSDGSSAPSDALSVPKPEFKPPSLPVHPVWRTASPPTHSVVINAVPEFDPWLYSRHYWSSIPEIMLSSSILLGLKGAVLSSAYIAAKYPCLGYGTAFIFGTALGNYVGQEANKRAYEQMGYWPGGYSP